MIARISDLRVTQATRFGVIVGLSREEALHIALIADLLTEIAIWTDLVFMFGDVQIDTDKSCSIEVDHNWRMRFEWLPEFGPVNIRLE